MKAKRSVFFLLLLFIVTLSLNHALASSVKTITFKVLFPDVGG